VSLNSCKQLFCLLLPFVVNSAVPQPQSDVFHINPIHVICTAIVTLALLGCDEVATQLELPFPWIPLEDVALNVEKDIAR